MKTQPPQAQAAPTNLSEALDNLRALDKAAAYNRREAEFAERQIKTAELQYEDGNCDHSEVLSAKRHARKLREISDASYKAADDAMQTARQMKAAAAS